MYLLLQAIKEHIDGSLLRDGQLVLPVGDGTGLVKVVFHQPEYRGFHRKIIEDLLYSVYLPGAAIEKDQIGGLPE